MDRKLTGQVAHCAGDAAERRISQDYERRGFSVSRRWRGAAGEIDLVAQGHGRVVFVEVKKSRSIASAAERLSERQMQRIYAAAGEFLSGTADGQMTDVRFDVALMDATGQYEIIENAFGQF